MTENVQYTVKRCEQIQRDVENLIILRRNLDKAILRIELTDMCDESTYYTFGNHYFADDLKQRLLKSMVDAAIDQLRKECLEYLIQFLNEKRNKNFISSASSIANYPCR